MINIEKQQNGEIITVSLRGEVDASSSIQLDNAIKKVMEDGHKKILIDGSELMYISSAGLGVFMSYLQDFENSGIKMALYGLNEKVRNVFNILGLDQLLNMPDTREEAEKIVNN